MEVIYKLTSRFATSALFYQETVEGDDVTKRDTIDDSVKHGLLKDALFQAPPFENQYRRCGFNPHRRYVLQMKKND